MQDYLLEVRNLSKYYAGVKALDNVSMGFRKGEVHALAGENGAGKSTLIKMLTGAIEPTHGEIILEGKSYTKFDPISAIEKGISAVYQEFNLVPYLSAAENVFFGKERKKGVFVDRKSMNAEVGRMLSDMGIKMNPAIRVSDMGVAYQQIIEIVKAVAAHSRILILDEPTAPLTNNETKVLFNIVKKLKENDVTIIFISHRMEEIFEICDRVTVMRDGKYIATENTADIDRRKLIAYMVGRELGENYPPRTKELGDTVLKVQKMSSEKVHDINFKLRKGEILGFGGLVGAGRTEVMQALFGADKIASGELTLNGKRMKPKSPGKVLEKGIGLIPEDRKNQGIFLGLSIKENVTFSSLKQAMTGPFINKQKDTAIADEYVDKLRIKTPASISW